MKEDTADIEERGVLLFRHALRPTWIVHEESKDNGIDYRVELKKEGKASGIFFFAQLKAQLKAKLIQKERFASFNLEIQRLKQYCEMRSPVFLVVSDLHREKCYYVFLQKHADTMRYQSWRKCEGGKVAIHVPTDNSISASTILVEDLRQASRYIASRQIQEGIGYDEEFYEKMDSRFSVEMTISAKQRGFFIKANENVSINYVINKDKLPIGEYDKFLRGLPMTVAPGAVVIDGSPLWEHIAKMVCEGGGQLIMKSRQEGSLSVSLNDATGKVKAKIGYLPCTLEGGIAEARYSACSPLNLIRINGIVQFDGMSQSEFNLKFNAGGWVNKRILDLDFFQEVCAFLCEHETGNKFLVELNFEGHETVALAIGESLEFNNEAIRGLLEILQKVRSICRYFNINPIVPNHFEDDLKENIEFLHRIATGRDIPVKPNFDKLTTNISIIEAKRLYQEQNDGHLTNVILVDSIFKKTLFGETVIVSDWRHVFFNLKLLKGYRYLKKMIKLNQQSIQLEFVPTESTTASITNSKEFEPPSPIGT